MHIRERPSRTPYVVIPGNNDATIRSWALNTPISGKLTPLSTYLGHTTGQHHYSNASEHARLTTLLSGH
jgi:hypothetical protein